MVHVLFETFSSLNSFQLLISIYISLCNPSQMTTAIAIDDVRREVKILRALSGHKNQIRFYDAYEDDWNVYMVME